MRLSALIGLVLSLVSVAALAKDPSPDSVKGLYLTTDFPAVTIRAGEEADLPLTIYNYGLPPQRTALTVAEAPPGWKTEIQGSGKPVAAAFVDYDGKASLTLKLTIPESEKPGDYRLTLNAEGDAAKSSLPIAVTLAPPLAAKLTATPKFPMLSGAARSSFDFAVTVKNEGANDMTVVLKTDAPEGYTATYKEQYGTQDITSLLIKAGESKDLTVSVKPNPSAPSGQVPVTFEAIGDKVNASAQLTLDIGGLPAITITGPDDRLSGEAYAGQERSIPLTIANIGSAPVVNVGLSASPPQGWKVAFDPKRLPTIPVGGQQKVNVLLTPGAQAIAGDYLLNISAIGDGVDQNVSYRVTVLTSTLWGVAGVGVILIALLVLVGAVGRFGRR
jgi:uncharacterized membrane protein